MTRRPRPLTNLVDEDRVVLFPALGHLSRDGRQWVVNVHGDVWAAGEPSLGKRMMLRVLRRAMRASDEALASPIFQLRISRFTARSQPGRRIAVQIGERVHVLPKKSRRNGHFQAAVRIPVRELDEFRVNHGVWFPLGGLRGGHDNNGAPGSIPIAVCGAAEPAVASSQAFLLSRTGLSVISDIDDTLKHSHVACKRTLLANTFLRPFMTIPGMAARFRAWADAGAAFHYVSSSPWQLYEHLAEHLAMERFPDGSFHLRHFGLRYQLLRRLLIFRRTGKAAIVRGILKMFPYRRFVFVGDSGERDPEIYGALARRYPEQIAGIFIRQISGPGNNRRRYSRAFRGIDPALVRLFRHAWELDDDPTVEVAMRDIS